MLRAKLSFLLRVGLGYLTLGRQTRTLSGGEAQRINLASSLGSALVGTLYVLDEPSVGLHPRDNLRLIRILKQLRDQGNTVLVVEHDEDMIRVADHIVDIGLGAGEQGGRVIFSGPLDALLQDTRSLTARYLRGELAIPMPHTRRRGVGQRIRLRGASEHNLRDVDVDIPLNMLTCVTGVSGSGKSTLVKLLSNRLTVMSGRMTRADRLDVAYFAQHQLDELNPDGSAYDHVRRLMPDAPEARVRARAGAIGFSAEAADTPSANLSGGEKARLLLGLATNAGPHLIVLDEPTNHLDIDSRAALIDAINDYAGAVILVSHDRYLIEACADRLWLVADGQVTPFDGDLDDYRRFVLADRRDDKARDRQPKSASRGDARRAAAQLRIELAPLRRRIADAEAVVARLNDEIARIDTALADAGLFARDPAKAAQLSKERSNAVNALARAEDDWLAASEALEAAMR